MEQSEFTLGQPAPRCGKRARKPSAEFKVVALRECPMPADMQLCDTPQIALAEMLGDNEDGLAETLEDFGL